MEYLADLGYIGIFIAAFLAATILPLSSELVLVALLLNGLSPTLLIVIATSGNVLGSLTNYALGYWAGKHTRFFNITNDQFKHAQYRFKQYGILSLCFAWVPIIGDPLTLVAGVLRVPVIWFLTLVTIGKLLRYIVVSYTALNFT